MNKTQFEQNIVAKLLRKDDRSDQWYVPVRDFATHKGKLIIYLSNGHTIETDQVWNLDIDGFRAALTVYEDDPKSKGLTQATSFSHYVPYALVEYASTTVTHSFPSAPEKTA